MSKKRLNNEGSISYSKSRGRWCARALNGHTGKYITRFRPSQKEALAELKILQTQIARLGKRLTSDDGNVLLKDFLINTWLPTKKHSVKELTYINYELVVRLHLIPRLGRLRLRDIQGFHLTAAWNAMMAEGMTAHVPQTCQRKLYNALEMARKEGLMPSNPCVDASLPSVPRIGLRVLDEDQKDIALAYAEDHYPVYYPIFYLALETSLRRGELLGLEWRDIDFDKKRLHVARSVYMAKGGIRTTTSTKTAESERTVILFKESVELLKLIKFQQKLDADNFGYEQTRITPVFTCPGGQRSKLDEKKNHCGCTLANHQHLVESRPLLGEAVTHAWKRMMRELGTDYEATRFHDTRHTHATELLMEGTLVSGVQERLGHKKESTTTDIYKHIIEGVQKTAMEQFETRRTEKRRTKSWSATLSAT